MLIASDSGGDYAFLNLKTPGFDLTDRGVSGRAVPAGLDAFIYSERGVYRSGETVQVTALVRDGQGMAALDVPLTLVVERPDGVEYRRAVVPDQGLGGRALSVALVPSAPTGTWRVRAFADPKRPPVGEATFLVEDYVPDRIEFDLASKAKGVSKTSAAEITVDGRFLYGAPAAKLELEGEVIVSPASERPGFARYQFGLADEDVETTRQPLENLPATDPNGKANFVVKLEKQPETTRPLEAQVVVRMAEPGGRAVERELTLPVTAGGPMIGVKPLFSGRSLGEGENATFDVVFAAPDGASLARNVIGDRLVSTVTQDVAAGTAQLRVPVGSDWGSGAYVVATLRRPLDSRAERMPGRAIGVQWFSINRKARTLALDMSLPRLLRPNSALRIPIRVDGLNPGEEARIVVAAVDVGILNLTGYRPPAPDDYYLGQRRLTAEIRDLYGQLIDGMQGARGPIKTGGDAAVELEGSPPTPKALALHSGIVTVKADGTAEAGFDIPGFAGPARVMAIRR